MKLSCTILWCILISVGTAAQSPNYVDFELDILKFGYSTNSAEAVSGGWSFGGELRYNATNQFSIGIGGNVEVYGTDFDGDAEVDVSSSSMLVGDYYLTGQSSNRGFFGLGFGIISTGSVTIVDGQVEETIHGHKGLGLAPRAGFEFGHIRLMAQYNIALREEQYNSFGLTVALTLWGGYKGNGRTRGSTTTKM